MATFHFDLVSPEKLLFSGDVEQVDVPGAEGDFGVLANHAPFVATLRPGILTVHGAGGAQKIVVLGGFAEVSAQELTVLADVAEAVEDIDRTMICLLYTSDAADDLLCVDLGGRRIIKKKKKQKLPTITNQLH